MRFSCQLIQGCHRVQNLRNVLCFAYLYSLQFVWSFGSSDAMMQPVFFHRTRPDDAKSTKSSSFFTARCSSSRIVGQKLKITDMHSQVEIKSSSENWWQKILALVLTTAVLALAMEAARWQIIWCVSETSYVRWNLRKLCKILDQNWHHGCQKMKGFAFGSRRNEFSNSISHRRSLENTSIEL